MSGITGPHRSIAAVHVHPAWAVVGVLGVCMGIMVVVTAIVKAAV